MRNSFVVGFRPNGTIALLGKVPTGHELCLWAICDLHLHMIVFLLQAQFLHCLVSKQPDYLLFCLNLIILGLDPLCWEWVWTMLLWCNVGGYLSVIGIVDPLGGYTKMGLVRRFLADFRSFDPRLVCWLGVVGFSFDVFKDDAMLYAWFTSLNRCH